MSTSGEHMVHEAQHGGQLGMSETMHIEIVSDRAGEYQVYLYDSLGNPLPLKGVTVELALIDTAGKELQIVPASLSVNADYFFSKGSATNLARTDVRVKVSLPNNAKPVEMDFTLQYQR